MRELIPWRKKKQEEEMDSSFPLSRGFGPLERLYRDLDDLFNRWAPDRSLRLGQSDRWMGGMFPSVDVAETDREITVTAELPGLDEKDLKVSLENGRLTLEGEKRQAEERKEKDQVHIERSYGHFRRVIELPGGIDEEGVKARFKKGVLEVRLPRTAEAATERKHIAIES